MSIEQQFEGSQIDRIYDALSHHHRRVVLSCLLERDDPIVFDDLVEYVAMQLEPDGETEMGRLQERIAVSLHHRHLGKLADAGLISFESDEKRVVTATQDARRVQNMPVPVKNFNTSIYITVCVMM